MAMIRHLLLGFIGVALFSCSQPEPKVLRIGLNAWPGYEYLALAHELGYYKDEGLEVKMIPFQTLADGRRAFEKGQFDVMAGTLMEFYTTREVDGLNPVIFMVADFSNGGDMLLARNEITRVADLKGKRLGLEAGSVDVLTAANALASAGLSFNDVTLVPLPQPSNIAALLEGEIDAAQTYPPFATSALADPNIVRIFDTSQTPGNIVDVLFTSSEIVQTRGQDLVKVVNAFNRALNYQKTNPEDAYRRMAKREGLTTEEFIDALSGLVIVEQAQQATYLQQGKMLQLLQATHSALTEINVIAGPPCDQHCFTDVALKSEP
ncbi:ABC transporter substrate-binding protein [Motilimonas eburnea]|uniref:ABC transporter substrate-binding protein n=1 Tax=Motilimonas eburnea TaxID=1737488 RepID=UPI001E2909BC|nr:ABC transporter substrate-binding protein [Motilimonas eburnea]MCE2570948.1 ABC transporter substrate-binding protein [Motilimonas eburnea]